MRTDRPRQTCQVLQSGNAGEGRIPQGKSLVNPPAKEVPHAPWGYCCEALVKLPSQGGPSRA